MKKVYFIIASMVVLFLVAISCTDKDYGQNSNNGNTNYQNRRDTGGSDRDYPRNNNGEWPKDTPHNGADTTVRDRMPGTK